MKLLVELLSELALETVVPDSPRALLLLALVGGSGLSGAIVWLLFISERPLHQPDWGFSAIIYGIVFGAMGAMLTGLHLAREENDRFLAAAAMLMNVAAIALGTVAAFVGR